jgi:hypothetical protein
MCLTWFRFWNVFDMISILRRVDMISILKRVNMISILKCVNMKSTFINLETCYKQIILIACWIYNEMNVIFLY